MASLIIYTTDFTYIDRTIDDILNKTSPELISEIIVCDDRNSGYLRDGVVVVPTANIGRAAAWNAAAKLAITEQLVFLRQATKVSSDWLPPLLGVLQERQTIVSSVVHTLDAQSWMLEETRWRRFGWRWNLAIYDRQYVNKTDSATVSSYCLAVNRSWLFELGGFDEGMPVVGGTETTELALRCWLFGGRVEVADASVIGALVDVTVDNVAGLARIVEAWMPAYSSFFYDYYRIMPTDINVGRLDGLVRLQERQCVSVDTFLLEQLPELFGAYRLRQAAVGKSVAIIGTGPSVDMVNPALINRHDIVIGLDYMGLLFECDYVIATNVSVVTQLRAKYRDNKFILPILLENRVAGEFTPAEMIVPGCIQFELGRLQQVPQTLYPPFCNFDNPLHAAVHLALFMNPTVVTLFGCDHKVIGGKSHSAKIDYYDGGKLWLDSEATKRRFAIFEFGLNQLGRLASDLQIPLLRTNHV